MVGKRETDGWGGEAGVSPTLSPGNAGPSTPLPHPSDKDLSLGTPLRFAQDDGAPILDGRIKSGPPALWRRLLVLFFRIVVFACITPIAACAIGGFADFLFRGQLIAFAGDGHGVHSFGILTGGSAIDILRGDLEGVEEQAGAARIEAGAEQRSYDLGGRYLDGGGILQHGELDVTPVGGLRFGHGMHAGVEITIGRLEQSRRLASLPVGLDMTAKLVYQAPPHPYFVNKFLVFLSLQTGLRCKIVKTKKFPAKSSRIRSYVTFRPLLAASGWKPRDEGAPGRLEGKLLRIIVRRRGEIICKGLAVQAMTCGAAGGGRAGGGGGAPLS